MRGRAHHKYVPKYLLRENKIDYGEFCVCIETGLFCNMLVFTELARINLLQILKKSDDGEKSKNPTVLIVGISLGMRLRILPLSDLVNRFVTAELLQQGRMNACIAEYVDHSPP